MGTFNKIHIAVTALLFFLLAATFFIYLYFQHKEIIYNPLDNPKIQELIRKDSINQIKYQKGIDSIGALYQQTDKSKDSLYQAADRKIEGVKRLFIIWKSEKERISKLNEFDLEKEINKIINEQSN
jgi:hypothetical protein